MFWLYKWLEDRDITSAGEAEYRLKEPKELAGLHDLAAAVPYTTEPLDSTTGEWDLLGGRGVDLSGELDCFAWECRKAQVDKLLSHAWHYFDRIVVVGPSAHRVAGDLENGASEAGLGRLTSDIRLLLYLREIGAEPLVVFRQKPPPCEVHLDLHAREVGLDQALVCLDALAERAARVAEIQTQRHGDHFHYEFVHPRFEHTVWGTVRPEGQDLPFEVSRAVFRRYMSHLTSDVRAAQTLSLPLASTIQVHGDLLGLTARSPSAAELMFDLRLPVVDGADVRTLLELREAEGEYFERFRLALRLAAEERLPAGDHDSVAIAQQIQREVIEPAIADIAVRLRAAADTLAVKTRLTTRLSAVLIACGVYLQEPLIVSAGLTAAGASMQAWMKHEDEVGRARLSNMFFLWEAEQHRH
ncbi:MAG TPA: hypothetical protein VFP23_10055 [Solirubrobacterales bacterium]|nr:hypothetical protein [Solirubrobacterales bacterium]